MYHVHTSWTETTKQVGNTFDLLLLNHSPGFICITISSSVIMEDLCEFHKLEDQLTHGVVKEYTSAIEAAMACIGQVHRTTWLDCLPIKERKELTEQFE